MEVSLVGGGQGSTSHEVLLHGPISHGGSLIRGTPYIFVSSTYPSSVILGYSCNSVGLPHKPLCVPRQEGDSG